MFCQFNGKIVNCDNIKYIVCSHFAQFGYIYVHYTNYESECVRGEEAIKVMELLSPDIFEEPDVKSSKDGWWLHNLVGHPLMQIFQWAHLPKWADWIHKKTIPKLKIIGK